MNIVEQTPPPFVTLYYILYKLHLKWHAVHLYTLFAAYSTKISCILW